ncbi:Altered inheritance of mitochondria protein 9 [Lasiodiplodia hormozganensis]|uniref:Altered inheritance of mitochondria protein 9 n=1 Tax=Lasiodiplodia hormozganensis TaxID=869390 RepID=A0AA40CJ03_9PEZI|nr:Altered inheritance of mitochondria protein 9 [Lasiodiplodia hormozganensis]
MASFQPVDSEGSSSDAAFDYRDIFKSSSDGYSLSSSSSNASGSVNSRDIFRMSSNSDENGSGENSSEENGNDEEDNEEDDSYEDDSEEEESEEDESDDDDDSFTSCDEVKLRIPTAEDFGNLPFRVTTCGPPQVDTKVHTDIMAFKFSPVMCFWEPIWIIQPDIDVITDMIRPYARLCGLPNEDISVEFLSQGAWNSVYVVSSADKSSQCVFRCALPSNPWFRMQLEVSTMEYVRMHTTIPVPKVFAFNSSMQNPLGLEWMLMEKVNGITYAEAIQNNTITFDAEVALHRTVADWVHQLSQLTFSQMGCLYRRWDLPITDPDAFVLGPLNDWEYIVDIRPDLATHRGPFASKADFITSLIALRIGEANHPRIKQRADYFAARRSAIPMPPPPPPPPPAVEEFERGGANDMYTHAAIANVPTYALALQSLLPLCAAATERFFDNGGPDDRDRRTYLYHNDIHGNNIMVDAATGKPVALLDWEGAYACPHEWMQRYPPVVDEKDYRNPVDIDATNAEMGWRPMDEAERAAAQRGWNRVLLRRVYDERLRELGSPVLLRERAVDGDLDRIRYRVLRMEEFYDDWKFVNGMKDRQLERLLGVTKL